jgi:phage terminase large subunit-like protein
MQQPTSESSAIVSSQNVENLAIGQPAAPVTTSSRAWDTAFEIKNNSDYSAHAPRGACSTTRKKGTNPRSSCSMRSKTAWTFPDLKAAALKHWKEWEPDAFIVEKKASGAPLIQELRNMGIPVQEYEP